MEPKIKNLLLYLIATIVNLLSFSSGISIGWITAFFSKNPIGRPLTSTEISWIVVFFPLGAALGPLFAGTFAEKIGRKRTLLTIGIVNSVALLITVFAKSITLFYIARSLAGVALGSSFTVVPMFLAEISGNDNRGTFVCSMIIFETIGMNFAQIVGPYLSIQNYSIVCLVPLLIFVPSFAIMGPETPAFLASTNNEKALTASLSRLRNKNSEDINLEMRSILQTVQDNNLVRQEIWDLFRHKCLCKGLMISLGVVTLSQIAGIGVVFPYMQKTFAPQILDIIVGSFQVFGTVLSFVAVDRLGRRILLLASSLCACFSLATLGLYLSLASNGFAIEWLSWLPALCSIMFIFAYNAGLHPVPWVIMTELVPRNFTSIVSTLTSVMNFVTMLLLIIAFPFFFEWIKTATFAFIVSAFCLINSGFIYAILPETKGKSL